jgi:hypothetical protein
MTKLIQGTHREKIAAEDVGRLRRSGVLVEDGRRERPRWFDGRFLAARDLVREQQYFLTREADLGQAAGSGVAEGLAVREGDEPQTLVIGAGHGITPSGELVRLPSDLTVRLADLPRAEQFTAKFGLGRLPQPPLRSRTGLFVLALRPVEFTASPIGAYPTSITGQRAVEDSDVVEATAVVLVPWQDDGATDALEARRGRAARAIFVEGLDRGLSANVLPVAMIALANNTLAWMDAPMVRRELGADRGDLPAVSFAPQGLRLAHLLQHEGHLGDVVRTMNGRSFAASAFFPALPPAGPLPPGTIDPNDFTQGYFPAGIDVEFSIIPEDELPALVEESLALPAIDLAAAGETLESTSVLVLASVPRNEWRAVLGRLTTLVRAVRPAAPNLVAARRPLEILQRLRLPRPFVLPLDPTSPSDAEWRRLARLPNLWFVRRRNLAYRVELAGTAVRVAGTEVDRDVIIRRIDSLGLRDRLNTVFERATPAARLEVENLLASPRFADSPTITAAAIGELSRTETLDRASTLRTAAEFTDSRVGAGLARIDSGTDVATNTAALSAIASSPEWRELDTAAASAPTASVATIATERTGASLTPTRVSLASAAVSPAIAGGASITRPGVTRPSVGGTLGIGGRPRDAATTATPARPLRAKTATGKAATAKTAASRTGAAGTTSASTAAAKTAPAKRRRGGTTRTQK